MELIRRRRSAHLGDESELRIDGPGFLVMTAVLVTVVAQVSEPGSPLDLLLVAPALVAFVLQDRLRWLPPEVLAALVVVPIVVVVCGRGVLEPMLFLSVTMILVLAASTASTARAVAIAVVAAVAPWLVARQFTPDEGIGWQAWMMAHLFTCSLGRLLHRQRSLITELEGARRALAEQAVAEERRRIARELHDLAGHTLAAVLLHVTGARHVLRRDLDDAERALLDAEQVGRSSLDQIRATVAALRTDERGTDPALAGSADLDLLFDEYRRAGIAIDSDIGATVLSVPGAIGIALHRISREALANVARHAPGNAVAVRAAVVDGAVNLTVEDRGTPAAEPEPGAGHFGLVGMGERARGLGGSFAAGPTEAGWRVDVRLPVAPVVDSQLLAR